MWGPLAAKGGKGFKEEGVRCLVKCCLWLGCHEDWGLVGSSKPTIGNLGKHPWRGAGSQLGNVHEGLGVQNWRQLFQEVCCQGEQRNGGHQRDLVREARSVLVRDGPLREPGHRAGGQLPLEGAGTVHPWGTGQEGRSHGCIWKGVWPASMGLVF